MPLEIAEQIKNTVVTVENFPKPGISYKDIAPLFLNPSLSGAMVSNLAEHYRQMHVEGIIGLESRGFLIGMPLAIQLNVPFILIRKKGKLPRETYAEHYNLEYGQATIEMQKDAIKPGQKILIHDDVLATGGTASAAARLVHQAQAEVIGFSFLIELSFLNGRDVLTPFSNNIHTLATY